MSRTKPEARHEWGEAGGISGADDHRDRIARRTHSPAKLIAGGPAAVWNLFFGLQPLYPERLVLGETRVAAALLRSALLSGLSKTRAKAQYFATLLHMVEVTPWGG